MYTTFVGDIYVKQSTNLAKPFKCLQDMIPATEVLALFRISPMTLRNWRKDLQFPAYRFGGGDKKLTLFYKPDLITWAKTHDKTIHESHV